MNRWQWVLVAVWLAWIAWVLVTDDTRCRRELSCADYNNCNERLVCE